MASPSEVPRNLNEALSSFQRRLTSVERRRPGDGVNIDGQCEFGGGAGGDGGYYGGGGDYPIPDFPDSSYPPYFPDWWDDYVTDNPDWFQDWADGNPDWFQDWADGNPGGFGGALNAGANIAIEGDTVHFEVVFTEPVSPRIGQLWFDASA